MALQMIDNLFTPNVVAAVFNNLPALETPVMDTVFFDRAQLPFSLVAKEEILSVVDELPMINRAGNAVSTVNPAINMQWYEPLPLRFSRHIAAKMLNDLKNVPQASRDAWIGNTLDEMRRLFRKTTEAICAVALSGTLKWPVVVQGAGTFTDFEVGWGSPASVTPSVLWSASTVKMSDVFACLLAMKEQLQANGFGSMVEVWAGSTAFGNLLNIAGAYPDKGSLKVTVDHRFIEVGGFRVVNRAETYKDPATGTAKPFLDPKTVKMIATNAGHKLVYCAVDDLDADLQAMPFFVKQVKTDDPSGLMLYGDGKPFPIVNVKGVCDAVVLN